MFRAILCVSLVLGSIAPYSTRFSTGAIAQADPTPTPQRSGFRQFLHKLGQELGLSALMGSELINDGDEDLLAQSDDGRAFTGTAEDARDRALAQFPEDQRSEVEKAESFEAWMESLRRNAFSMGSADANSPFYTNHPLDTYGLLGQRVLLTNRQKPAFAQVDPRVVSIEVLDSTNRVVGTISPGSRRGANMNAYSAGPQSSSHLNSFRISYQGRPIHAFQNNVQAIAFVGPYIVFLDPSRVVTESNVVNLSMIDLRQFTPALGKTVLPIYRVPVKVSAEQLRDPSHLDLTVRGNKLLFAGQEIGLSVLDELSTLQSMVFNSTVSLVSPGSFSSTSLILDDMLKSMMDAAEDSAQLIAKDFEQAGIDNSLWNNFAHALRQEARTRSRIGATDSTARQELEAAREKLRTNNLTEIEQRLVEAINAEVGSGTDQGALDQRAEALALLAARIKADPNAGILRALRFGEDLAVDESLQNKIRDYESTVGKQRHLLSRINLLWAKLFIPKPLGAPRIQRALGMIAAGAMARDTVAETGLQRSRIPLEVLRTIVANRTVRIATPVLAGAVAALMMPAEAAQFAHQALDAGRIAVDSTFGWLSDFCKLTTTTWDRSWAFLNFDNIQAAYIENGRLPKAGFGIGSILGTLMATVYSIHLSVNTVLFGKAIKEGLGQRTTDRLSAQDALETNQSIGNRAARLVSYPFRWAREAVVAHLSKSKEDYYAALARAEAKKTGSAAEFTAEENAEVDAIIAEIKGHVRQEGEEITDLSETPLVQEMSQKSPHQIRGLGGAFMQLMFGYSTWSNTTQFFGRVWNPWFLVRNFWTRPRTVLTMLAFPNYYNRSVWGGERTVSGFHFPTYQNGGLRPWWNFGPLRRLATTEGTRQAMRDLDRYEQEIIQVEKRVHTESMRLAWIEMMKYAGEDKTLRELLRTGAVLNAHDPRLKTLNGKTRMFFMAYFTETFNRSMRQYLGDALDLNSASDVSDDALKRAALSAQVRPALTVEQARELVVRVAREQNVHETAYRIAHQALSGFVDRVVLDHQHRVSTSLDPQYNASLNRAKIASVQMDSPEAMARATRKYMTSIVTDKPMEIAFLLLFYAGIQDGGMLQPVHDEMNGPNSANYLSRYVFWNNWFTGIMISLLADTWMKVQMDYRLDQKQGFDGVPEGADAERGYMSWYWKQFKEKNNSWWQNYSYHLKLSFVNMPAYFLTAVVSNMMFLGRFDLDAFMMVYVMLLFPVTGFFDKFENAFEMASNWVVRKFPRKYHSHPKVQEYRARTLGPMRVYFQLAYNAVGNVTANLMTTLSLVTVPTIGPRSFARMLGFGFTPTEIVAHGLNRADRATGGVISPLLRACDQFFTKNYTDGTRLPRE